LQNELNGRMPQQPSESEAVARPSYLAHLASWRLSSPLHGHKRRITKRTHPPHAFAERHPGPSRRCAIISLPNRPPSESHLEQPADRFPGRQ
jgi:hypothetical protein